MSTFHGITALRSAFCLLLMLGFAPNSVAQNYHLDPPNVSGPDACAECHENTTDIWKKTHHAKTFKELPRREKASEIAGKLGVKRIKTAAECSGCHFTAQIEAGKPKAIAGISCESCHGAGKDWIDIHSDFGGKDVEAADETPAHKVQRYQRAEAAGMIRPSNVVGLIRNCYSCHMIADEKLVNNGGHPSSSAFEVVRWSQGEVRHNVWYSEENQPASIERQRLLFVVGQILNYEYALRALASATSNGDFAKAVAKQAKLSERRLNKLNEMQPIKELNQLAAIASTTKLGLNNAAGLNSAANKTAKLAEQVAANYDGSELAGLDAVLPKAEKYKGKVSR